MRNESSGPARFSGPELKKVGVIITDRHSVHLRCGACEQEWSPNLLTGGKLAPGYWKCPNGCNSEGSKA